VKAGVLSACSLHKNIPVLATVK